MKIIKGSKSYFVLFIVFLLTAACTQQSLDAELKADITGKAKEDINFAGVMFTVDNRKVTLRGNCPTRKSREKVLQLLGTIHMLKGIEDHLTIAPVTLSSSFSLRQQVDSLLSKYPAVTAAVSDTLVILEGKIKSKDLEQLLPMVVKLQTKVSAARLKRDIGEN